MLHWIKWLPPPQATLQMFRRTSQESTLSTPNFGGRMIGSISLLFQLCAVAMFSFSPWQVNFLLFLFSGASFASLSLPSLIFPLPEFPADHHDVDSIYYHVERFVFSSYIAIDSAWILLYPKSVPSPNFILWHHMVCLVGYNIITWTGWSQIQCHL